MIPWHLPHRLRAERSPGRLSVATPLADLCATACRVIPRRKAVGSGTRDDKWIFAERGIVTPEILCRHTWCVEAEEAIVDDFPATFYSILPAHKLPTGILLCFVHIVVVVANYYAVRHGKAPAVLLVSQVLCRRLDQLSDDPQPFLVYWIGVVWEQGPAISQCPPEVSGLGDWASGRRV